MVEKFDDKAYLNDKLRELGSFTMPQFWTMKNSDDSSSLLQTLERDNQYPIIGKPVRGRGSHGVKVCHDPQDLQNHLATLFQESPLVMLEEFLADEEATITVMPPSPENPGYWSLPPVTRFNHLDGIAPYNGVVAVTKNSRVITKDEMALDPAYNAAMRECERVAKLIQAAAPIRVDIRRFRDGSRFALFDVNMKPNMTGPGRPGRDNQAGLTTLAAEGIGWDYSTLLENILCSARALEVFRDYSPPF